MERDSRRESQTIYTPGLSAIAFVLTYIGTQYPSITLTSTYRFIHKLTEVFTSK